MKGRGNEHDEDRENDEIDLSGPFTFCGKFHPYISMRELVTWVNKASGGRARWTTKVLRRLLEARSATVTLPPFYEPRKGTKKERGWHFTTRPLLRRLMPEVYDELMSKVDDATALTEADLLDDAAA